MNKPAISNLSEEDETLRFTLSNINVSLANGIRRIILADIPTLVFRTTPYTENKSTIYSNTSRLNNELVKQRLSCIPIHISDTDFPYQDYIVEIKVQNDSDTIRYVTTKDFKIKNIKTDTYLSEPETRTVFPPDTITGDYISVVRLRPRLSDTIPGEEIHISSRTAVLPACHRQQWCRGTCPYLRNPMPSSSRRNTIANAISIYICIELKFCSYPSKITTHIQHIN